MSALSRVGNSLIAFAQGRSRADVTTERANAKLAELNVSEAERSIAKDRRLRGLLNALTPGEMPGDDDPGGSNSPITEHNQSGNTPSAISPEVFDLASTSSATLAQLATQFPDEFEALTQTAGLVTDVQRKQAADFAFALENAPPGQREKLIDDRVNMLRSTGRDASHTESLRGLSIEDQNAAARTMQVALMDNEDRLKLANEAPKTRSIVDGNERVDQQFNPLTGQFEEVGRGDRSPIQRVEQGEPGSFEKTGSQRGKQIVALEETATSTVQALETAASLLELVQSNESIIGKPGTFFRVTNDLLQTAIGISKGLGIKFSGSVDTLTNPENYDLSGLRGTAIDSELMRSGVVSLAFAAAAASGQTGRDVSDRDVQRFINEIGASTSDPRAFEAVIRQFGERLARNFTIRSRNQKINRPDLTENVMNALDGLADPASREAQALPGFEDLSPSDQQELIERLRRRQ